MKTTLYTLLFFFSISFSSSAQSGFIEVRDLIDWEKVLTLAEGSKTMIYVYYTDSDCDVCEQMEENALDDKEVKDYITSNYIPVLINTTNAGRFGIDFAGNFELRSMPASLWMTGGEFVWNTEEGLLSADELLKAFQSVNQLTVSYPELVPYAIRSGDTLTSDEWIKLIDISTINYTEYQAGIIRSFERNLSWDSLRLPVYWDYVQSYVIDINSPMFKYIRLNPDSTLGSEFPWPAYCDELYFYHIGNAVEERDSMMALNIERELLPYMPQDTAVDSLNSFMTLKLNLWQDYFIETDQFSIYLGTTGKMLREMKVTPELMAEEIKQLTNLSRSNKSLRTGIQWINRAIEQEEQAVYYIMKADLHIFLRERAAALDALEKAERLNPTEQEEVVIEWLQYSAREIF